ncbi:MAG: hypothetical protein AABZ14_03735 [Candidatus Margulisiibacteriota bacterium]
MSGNTIPLQEIYKNERGDGIDASLFQYAHPTYFINMDDSKIGGKDDSVMISGAGSTAQAGEMSHPRSVAPIPQRETAGYILNDKAFVALEKVTIQINDASKKYFDSKLGLGLEVSVVVDESNAYITAALTHYDPPKALAGGSGILVA